MQKTEGKLNCNNTLTPDLVWTFTIKLKAKKLKLKPQKVGTFSDLFFKDLHIKSKTFSTAFYKPFEKSSRFEKLKTQAKKLKVSAKF